MPQSMLVICYNGSHPHELSWVSSVIHCSFVSEFETVGFDSISHLVQEEFAGLVLGEPQEVTSSVIHYADLLAVALLMGLNQ